MTDEINKTCPSTMLPDFEDTVSGNPFGTPSASLHSPSIRSSVPNSPPYSNPSSRPSSVHQRGNAYGINDVAPPPLPNHRPSSIRESHARPQARTRSTFAAPSPLSGKTPKIARLRSTMVTEKNPVTKPWGDSKPSRARISYFITYALIFLGIALGGLQCYLKYTNVMLDRQPLCLIMEENFDDESTVFGDNGHFWHEIDMSGFGNQQFEMTTDSSNNTYIKDGKLYIVPTLTSDVLGADAVFNNSIYNITGCTYNETNGHSSSHDAGTGSGDFDMSAYLRSCSAVSNATLGKIINPVQSARISTRGKVGLKYGRVEVRAKMPVGDWLWPAIWMLPVDNTYGVWPMSGEIDIVESRGNGPRYPLRGSNVVQGSLNWGPISFLNGVSKTFSYWTERRKQYNEEFHTYVLEWTDKFMRVYVDTRMHTLLEVKFDKPFYERGDFPAVVQNGSTMITLENPWENGTYSTPFDQEFYLIMNVAVGGTQGWFPDYMGDKPWLDTSDNAMRDFYLAQSKWYQTWPENHDERGMVVDYVKMWEHC